MGYGGSIAGLKMFKFLGRCCVFERQKPLINGRVVFAPNGQRAASPAALRRADVLWKGKARVTIPYLTSTCTIVAVLLRGWCTNHSGGRAGGVAGEKARPGGVTACEASPRPLRLERRRANNRRQQVELGAQVCSLAVTLRRRRARMSRSRSATTQTSGLELKL